MMRQLFPFLISKQSENDYWSKLEENRSRWKIKSQWKTILDVKDLNPSQRIMFSSPYDQGVMENGGKWGSRFAPKSIASALKNLHFSQGRKNDVWQNLELSHDASEFKEGYVKFHSKFGDRPLIHLGGGHDTLYPFFQSLLNSTTESSQNQNWLLINIDSHTDTRIDTQPHSGNPISRLAKEFESRLKIWQIGIHPETNSVETLKSIPTTQQKITYFSQCKEMVREFESLVAEGWITSDTNIFLSLDFDALEPQYAQGVSAINGRGLSLEFVYSFYKLLVERKCLIRAVGFYEYNPLYDHISGLGAKVLAQLILHT
ncbi:MAG: arginase family protein [Bacteriovoracaceae bacterium]|nr:arginase family protein [Bacteriovoracaceae bacterium]